MSELIHKKPFSFFCKVKYKASAKVAGLVLFAFFFFFFFDILTVHQNRSANTLKEKPFITPLETLPKF